MKENIFKCDNNTTNPSVSSTPRNVKETIDWLLRLGRPPLPECPIEAAKQGKEPKQPCFLDGKYLKTVNWKQWQNTQPIEEIYKAWFQNPRTGIGTLGGWNGKHWLGWIDFDQKNFASGEECDRAIAAWREQYPLAKDAPMCRTPSGGYRFLMAFTREPENFKANSGFSLSPDGSRHVGELLSKNGGHTLLPPTIGVSGKAYEWVQWSEYPPIVDQPEDIGLYPLQKKTEAKSSHPNTTRLKNDWTGGNTLTDLLRDEIYPRLSLERAFNWHGHDFQQQGGKLKGNCPWHDSKSGTAFYAEIKDGSPVWRCPACEIGGGVIEYRHRLAGGNGSPRGSEFAALVEDLASEVGVSIRQNSNSALPSGFGFSDRDRSSAKSVRKLSLKEAVLKAREILSAESDELVANIKLEEIREACGMSEFGWERKIVKPLKRDLEGDRFKLELLGLLQIDDSVERIRQQALLAPKYQMSSSLIEKAMSAMKQRTQTPESKALDLDELFDLESEGLSWVIPGLLPEKETIVLAGAPKAGKTLLAIDAAYSVATGESYFLGEATKRGKVLLVSTDESANSTKAKLLNRGFRRCDKDSIKVLPTWDITQMGILETLLEDFRPDLVIIDSLRRINKGSEISENSAEFADAIYSLKESLERYGAAGILIHHTNKDREALGVHRLRGSSAIAGAVWGTWQLDQIPKPDPNNKKKLIVDPKDPTRTLSIFARDIEGQQLLIELNPENNSWTKAGEVGDSEEAQAERDTLRARILKLLGIPTHATGLSGSEIIDRLDADEVDKRSVYNCLNRMVSKRIITAKAAPGDKRYNIYSLPNCHTPKHSSVNCHTQETSPPPPSPPPTVSDDDYYAESPSKVLFENSHQNSHHPQKISHHPHVENPTDDYSNADREGDSEIVITFESERGGRGEKIQACVTVDRPELSHMQLTLVEQTASTSADEAKAIAHTHIATNVATGVAFKKDNNDVLFLAERLRFYTESFEFRSLVKGKAPEVVEAAIALVPDSHRERVLSDWRNELPGFPRNRTPSEPNIETNCIQQFDAGDRVMTPRGQGIVGFFSEDWGEYNVLLVDFHCTDYFKPSELRRLD